MSTIIYEEKQRFNQVWIYILLIILGMLPALIIFVLYYFGQNSNEAINISDVNLGVIISILLTVAILIFLRANYLKVQVTSNGQLYYRYFPFHLKNRELKREQIKSYQTIEFNPITDYGGYGIRIGTPKKGTAYIISGKQGIKFELNNNKIIVIGTQKPFELNSVLKSTFK